MDYINIPLGAKLSPEDNRDYLVSKLIAQVNVFPKEFIISYNHPIKNQGNINSCVAHSLAYCREITEEQQNKNYNQFSVGFIYGNRRDEDYQGKGMFPREALKSIQDFGDVLYNDFPYNEEYPAIKLKINYKKDSLIKKAEPYKISSYCRLYTIDEIKNALMQIGAVTVSYPIYKSFYNTNYYGIVPIPNTSKEQWMGHHMMTIIGWKIINNNEYWIVLNSWGSNWADKGKCYIRHDVEFNEAWSISDNILPHPEVEPEKQKYWRVQVGAFKNKENSERLALELKNKGFSVYITMIEGLFKCQLGAFVQKLNAENLRQRVISMGYNAFLVNY